MRMLSRYQSYIVTVLWVLWLLVIVFPSGILNAQADHNDEIQGSGNGSIVTNGAVFDFTDAVQLSTVDELPWIENIVASHYGGRSGHYYYGGYGNKLHSTNDYFVALPSNHDNLDCLGGKLGCRMSRCGVAEPALGELLNPSPAELESPVENFNFWPGLVTDQGHGWLIEGDEGEGLFRILEIKPSGKDGPIFEAYVGDVGPWNTEDPYWQDGSRPDAEDGVDTRGRRTNRAGIDLSYALAESLGFTGLMEIDWRWKTVDGKYVVSRQPTEWRW